MGDSLTFEEVCQYLVGPPFNVPLDRLWRMTRTQVARLYFCRRDKDGMPKAEKKKQGSIDHREQWRLIRRLQCWPEHKIEAELSVRFKEDKEDADG